MKNPLALFSVLGLAFTTAASAQVSTINSAHLQPRVFDDVPGSTATLQEVLHPGFFPSSITLADSGVSAPSGFANRHVWTFSSDQGATPYVFGPNDYFSASFALDLTGSPITPRKEAGFLFSTGSSGDIQFIVNTDGHEVVQFGGISFYSFNVNNGITYNSGDTIVMGMSYFLDANGKNALQFSANGTLSPLFEFGPSVGAGALDIGTGSTLGGYFQIVNDPSNPNNAGQAMFSRITITPIPEPSAFALLGLGALAALWRRRA